MWVSTDTNGLRSLYLREFPADKRPPEAILDLLVDLQALETGKRIYAVTSLGNLWFTTASDYSVADKHASVTVIPSGDFFAVAFVPPGQHRSSAQAVVSGVDLVPAVRAFLLRLVTP